MSNRNNENDHFFKHKPHPSAASVFVPSICANIRPQLRVGEVLLETPGAMRVRLVDEKFLNGSRTLWLDKRHAQLAGDSVYIDRHVAARDGLL